MQKARQEKKDEGHQMTEGRQFHGRPRPQVCGNGVEPFFPVEIHVLTGVENIKTGRPENDPSPKITGGQAHVPVTAIQPATGAMPRARPNR